jgi:hypothetical protein
MVFAVIALICGLTATPELRADHFVFGGGSTESDGFWVSGPNARFYKNSPGVTFGLIQPPGSAKTYAYLLLIKGVEPKGTNYGGGCKNDVNAATSWFELEANGVKLRVEYKMEIDAQNKKPVSESLTVNGKSIELPKGRVLLVSFAGKDITWQQDAVELPQSPTAPRTTQDVEALAKDHVKRLRQESEAVRAFLN